MKGIYCLIAFWVLPAALVAQSFVFPKFSKSVQSAGELALPGWNVKDSVSGDLNRDNAQDMAVVLEYVDSVQEVRTDSIEHTGRPRVLVILFRDTAIGNYLVVCQNNTFILRVGEEGTLRDPYDEMTIEGGVLTINFAFVRGGSTYKFRWQKGDFYLIGAYIGRRWANAMEDWDANLSTKRAEHTWTDPDNPKEHREWKVLKGLSPIKMRDIEKFSKLDIF